MYHQVQRTCSVTLSRPHGRGRAKRLLWETERIRRERTSCGHTPTRSHHDVGRCGASSVFAMHVWARPARRLGRVVDRWRDPVSRRHPPMRGCCGVAMTISYQQPAAERSVDLIYRAAASGAACWARNHRGHVRGLPMARWIGGLVTTPQDRLRSYLAAGRRSPRTGRHRCRRDRPAECGGGAGNVALGNVPSRRALVSLVARQRRGAR